MLSITARIGEVVAVGDSLIRVVRPGRDWHGRVRLDITADPSIVIRRHALVEQLLGRPLTKRDDLNELRREVVSVLEELVEELP